MIPQHRIEIDMAARGMVSGTLAEWPLLKSALKAAGMDYPDSTTAAQLKQVCRDLCWKPYSKS